MFFAALLCACSSLSPKSSDTAKAKEYVSKSVQLNPGYQDAVNLQKSIK